MKKAPIILLLATTLLAPKLLEQKYTVETVVVKIEEPSTIHTNGRVKCKAENSRVFYLDGIEDWEEGDIAEITLKDNGTPETYKDDYIVDVKYTGWIY